MWQIEEKRLHAFLVEFVPVGAVARFLQLVRVEHLLELVAHRNREIGFSQMKGFRYERETCVRNDRFCNHQVGKKPIKAGLFINDIAFLPRAPESVSNKSAAHGTQNL